MPDVVFLRFTDAAEAIAALMQAGIEPVEDEAGKLHLPIDGTVQGNCFALSIVGGDGTIRRPAEETMAGTGENLSAGTALPGYHINLVFSAPPPAVLLNQAITPDDPQEIFYLSR